jgi:glycerol-3-phosphate acyltransferase PlsY
MALRRSGGKGLATGIAVLLLIDWRLAVGILAIYFLTLKILRTDETWPSIIAVGATPLLVWWLSRDLLTTLAVLLVSAVVIIKHLPDVREGFYVQAGTEQ